MNTLLDLRSSHWTLHILPPHYPKHLLLGAAAFAEHGPLTVLDCGRQYDSSIVARAARGRIEVMDRIHVQRAFICYEAARLVAQTRVGTTPVLILDLLAGFYDENVRMQTRKYLLENTLLHLARLGRGAGLAVSVHRPPVSAESTYLFERLESAAPQVLTYESHETTGDSRQMRLFPWET